MKNRVGYFDIAKGLGIILVIIGHIEYVPLEIRTYIVTFHMPVFLVISGMLMHLSHEAERPWPVLIKGKLRRIMLPYLVFSILFPIIDEIYFAVTGNTKVTSFLTNMIVGLSLTGVSVLWFLPALFLASIAVLALVKSRKRVWGIIIVLAIIAALGGAALLFRPLSLMMWRAIYCILPVLSGYLLLPLFRKAEAHPFVLLPVSATVFVMLYFTGKANGTVDLHYLVLGNPALYFFNAMAGSLALLMLSVFLEKVLPSAVSALLSFYGRHSLFIMITHINFFILYLGERVGFFVSDASPFAKGWIFNIVTVISVLCAETVMILVWEWILQTLLPRISKLFVSRDHAK